MGTSSGEAWAKALYMASVGLGSDEQPWASTHAWADGEHEYDGRSFMPDGSAACNPSSRTLSLPDG
eukprot:13524524-Heterocapsa_arctica.AAC.1